MREEKRIYVVLPAVVEVGETAGGRVTVAQPAGRQIAQACHVVSKLRLDMFFHEPRQKSFEFEPITTIILKARDSKEIAHVGLLLLKTLHVVTFQDENREAYGPAQPTTALAVLAKPNQVKGILDYLPLWGS
jgi:hypothetical protein